MGTIKKFIVSLIALVLYQIFSWGYWMKPRFDQEWQIKEIEPGFKHQIVSMTANKYGLFVLVKSIGDKVSPLELTKKAEEMTKKEREDFIYEHRIIGNVFSENVISLMNDKEKIHTINFVIQHFLSGKNLQK